MSASAWFALSLLVLAAGVALLGIAGWVRSHREQRTSATLKTALQPRDEARDTEATRRDSLGWLERFGRRSVAAAWRPRCWPTRTGCCWTWPAGTRAAAPPSISACACCWRCWCWRWRWRSAARRAWPG
jgi:hypothetical protein